MNKKEIEFIDENFVEADFPKSELKENKLKLLFKSGALTEEQYIKALGNL